MLSVSGPSILCWDDSRATPMSQVSASAQTNLVGDHYPVECYDWRRLSGAMRIILALPWTAAPESSL